jgi:hypothetical protein
MPRTEWRAKGRASIALVGCALFAVLGTDSCGGKLALDVGEDGGDAEADATPAGDCGPLDPTLTCGVDACGNPVAPVCRPSLWVCPPIPSGCLDAAPPDGASPPAGFRCGAGTCPPDTFCQDPWGTMPGACIPFPLECKKTPADPSATCACLEHRAAQDRVCRPTRLLCPYPTADLNGLHVGCIAD